MRIFTFEPDVVAELCTEICCVHEGGFLDDIVNLGRENEPEVIWGIFWEIVVAGEPGVGNGLWGGGGVLEGSGHQGHVTAKIRIT